MKILFIAGAAAFLLYKSHIAARLLKLFELPEDPEAPEVDETPTRPQLEAHAIYILESRGLSTDYVKYMSNRLLAEIIEEYYTSR
jgi:hypothetical protein